jgi:hypothetical protein
MRTDELIEQLAENAAPARRHAAAHALAQGLATGALVALAFTAIVLGFRRDLLHAVGDWQYWAKFAYPLAVAALGFVTLERLSRPGMRAGRQAALEALPFAVLALVATAQWLAAPVADHGAMLLGHSWLVCPWLIVIVSLPVFAGVLWSMRALAPTRPALAGAAAGLFSGAAGAWIYALHCDETSLVFVAVWYTTGIVLMGAVGALAGRYVLRW